MKFNVNIAIIVITVLFRSTTLATDSDLWFPKEFNNTIECGLDHDILGLSLIDDYLYQFEKCSVIIYPPPLDKYLNINSLQINLENGTRFTFEDIQPNWQPNYCSYAKYEWKLQPQYSLIRLKVTSNKFNNHILLYLTGAFSSIPSTQYYAYDFDNHNDIKTKQTIHSGYKQYTLVNDGNEQILMHNRKSDDEYQFMEDPAINSGDKDLGHICIRHSNDGYQIKRQYTKSESVDIISLTQSILKTITLTFTVSEKLLFISQPEQLVYITDKNLLKRENIEIEFPMIKKSLKDFLLCKSRKQIITPKETKISEIFENKIIIISLPIIIIICFIMGIFIIIKTKNARKLNYTKRTIKSKTRTIGSSSLGGSIGTIKNTIKSSAFNSRTTKTNIR